jgi:alkylated DNA repair dioxygenase AlkB
MSTLFSIADEEVFLAIPGLSYYQQYVSTTEETQLETAIDAEPWDTAWKRRRQPYGASYGNRNDTTRPIPSWAQPLIARLHKDGIGDRLFDQMLINEYLPGQGISMHRDYAPFGRTVVSLSLLSDCVMDFRHATSGQRESMLLRRRSLLVLSDAARYEWQHGIAPRRTDRWEGVKLLRSRRLSVTFRLTKRSRNLSAENGDI